MKFKNLKKSVSFNKNRPKTQKYYLKTKTKKSNFLDENKNFMVKRL